MGPEIEAKFWLRVAKGEGCWLWTGSKDQLGYGRLLVNKKITGAHRISLEIHLGGLDPLLDVMHLCDTPSCVNPEHLQAGTHADNMADMKAKGRGRAPSGDAHWKRRLPDQCPRGEAISNATVTAEIVSAIRAKYAAGVRQCDLKREYGLSDQHVYLIVNRKSWKHVL